MSIAAYQGVCPTCRHDHSEPVTALASGSGDHTELERLADRNVELSVLAYKWMEAHDALKSGQPYDYPSPADVPTLLAENAALRESISRHDRQVSGMLRARLAAENRATEAERKLAEAVSIASKLSTAISWLDYPFVDNNTSEDELRSRVGFMMKDAEQPRAMLNKEAERG